MILTVKLVAAAALAWATVSPALACEMHASHPKLILADSEPVVMAPEEPVAAELPRSAVTDDAAMTVPEPEPAYMTNPVRGCSRGKDTTVYLTN